MLRHLRQRSEVITAIDNLRSIAQVGALVSTNIAATKRIAAATIAYQHIQGRRAVRPIPIAPGGTLHDYVPFYFAPRSPMLWYPAGIFD